MKRGGEGAWKETMMAAVYEWIRGLTAFFLFLSVMENLLPGKKYGKYIRLFAGMVLILIALQPFRGAADLEEVLARSYEGLVIRGEADELREDLGETEKQRLRQIFAQYESAVAQDVERLAQSCGVQAETCEVVLEDREDSPEFGRVTRIAVRLAAGNSEEDRRKLEQKVREYYGLEDGYVEIEIAGGERPVDRAFDDRSDPVYPGVSGGE